jgi:hypothetical protein
MKLVRSLAVWGLLLAALAPSGASAASFNFFSNDGLGPTGGAGNVGRANHYPSEIDVEGLPSELTKVTVTFPSFLSGSPDDIDMLLVSPEADLVMLMSDACGNSSKGGMHNDVITFDDDAPAVLADDGPCPDKTVATVKPANYVGGSPEPDEFGVGGGIFAPFGSVLSDFAGTDPNGIWELYVLDDNVEVNGFELGGWALTLTVPDPAGPPAPPTTTMPPTTTTTTQSAPASGTPPEASGGTKAASTGKRAAALAKCKLKKTKAKKARCRAKARKLPI